MNVTFENRLIKRPVRSRLGKNQNAAKNSLGDLRQKLAQNSRQRRLSVSSVRTDARTFLRNRKVRQPVKRDARAVVQRGRFTTSRGTSRSTQGLSIQTRNQRRPIRRNFRQNIPNLLSLNPILSAAFLSNHAINANPSDTLISLPAAGTTLSPIQGFKVEVRNLQNSVSLDDVYELFSSVGTLRSCNLVRPGFAEVVYNEASDAKEAVRLYNKRELDGRPMNVALLTAVSDHAGANTRFASRLGPTVVDPKSMSTKNWSFNNNRLSTGRTNPSGNLVAPMEVDMDVVRKALFNISTGPGQRKPVDFNVSLR